MGTQTFDNLRMIFPIQQNRDDSWSLLFWQIVANNIDAVEE